MSKPTKAYQEPTHDEIAAYARSIYEKEGCPEGKAVEHWLQAEAQLRVERKAQAGIPIAKAAPPTSQPAAKGKGKGASWQTPPPPPESPRANP